MTEGLRDSIAGDAIHLKIESDEQSELLMDENESSHNRSQVHLFDYETDSVTLITIAEALSYADYIGEPDRFSLLSFSGLEHYQTTQVRKVFHLHPLLDVECSSSIFNIKDSALALGNHFLLTVSELGEDFEHSVGIKVLLLPNMILMFSTKLPQCLTWITVASERKQSNEIRVQIEEDDGCSRIEKMLYRILEANVYRVERYVLKVTSEAKLANLYASELAYHERVDFIQRINMVKKGILTAAELVKPKVKLFQTLIQSQKFPPAFLPYLLSLQSRTETMNHRVTTSTELVKDAEHVYTASVHDSIVTGSERLSIMLKFYAAIWLMILPLNLIEAYFSMNVTVPWEQQGDLKAFGGIIGVSVFASVTLGIFFKAKGWL